MKKTVLTMFLLLATALAANAQKFALIDMEYILENIPDYQRGIQQLEQTSKQWQAEVEKQAEEAKNLYQAYQNSKNLTDAQKVKKEEEIVAKEKAVADLRRKYFGPEGEMYKQRAALMQPIEEAVYNAVKEIATRRGYAAVVDRASANSLIFASPDIDISNEVLARLGYSN